jgi:hypothetical protein
VTSVAPGRSRRSRARIGSATAPGGTPRVHRQGARWTVNGRHRVGPVADDRCAVGLEHLAGGRKVENHFRAGAHSRSGGDKRTAQGDNRRQYSIEWRLCSPPSVTGSTPYPADNRGPVKAPERCPDRVHGPLRANDGSRSR